MHFKSTFFLALSMFSLSACKTLKNTSTNHVTNETMYVTATCILNAMPMTSSKPYICVIVCPADSVLHQNIKIAEATVGKEVIAKVEKFDDYSFQGKGNYAYKNILRDIELEQGQPIRLTLVLEFESGGRTTYTIDHVPLTVVQ